MKRATLLLITVLIYLNIPAQNERLKKGQELTYQNSTYEIYNNRKESLKRYVIRYKVLNVLEDGYDMEARFELMDEYLRVKNSPDENWRNVRLVYPELDMENYNYLYQNTLFQQEKILFHLPNNGKPSDVKLIGRRVGLDPLMDQVISDEFMNTFRFPIIQLAPNIKVNDRVKLSSPHYYYKVIKKNADYIVLEDDGNPFRVDSLHKEFTKEPRSEQNQSKEPKDAVLKQRANKSIFDKNVKTFFYRGFLIMESNCIRRKNQFKFDAKTGVLLEILLSLEQDQRKMSDRIVLVSNPAIRIKGLVEQNAVGDTLFLIYKDKYQLTNEVDSVSAIISKDNTFEFVLPFDDLQQVWFDTENSIRFYVQPGDDLFITLSSIKGNIIDVKGVGSESVRYLLDKKLQLKSYELDKTSLTAPNKILDDTDYLNSVNQFLIEESNFISSNFINLTPEVYLAEYWNNQLSANSTYRVIEKHNDRIKRLNKSAVKVKSREINLPRGNCFKDIHLNNELMRFATSNVNYNFFTQYFHVGDKIKAEIGLSKRTGRYQMDNSTLEHYNTIDNFFEGYIAFQLKFKVVLAALNDGSRDIYSNLFNRFKSEYKHHESLEILNEIYQKVEQLRPGTKAPPFELVDIKGKIVRLKDFLGKALFIDFYVNRNRYHINDVDRLSSNLKEFIENPNVVFILIYVEKGSAQDRLKFENLKFDGVKLVASEQQAKELSGLYGSPHLAHQAVVDVGGLMLTRIPPVLDRLFSRPNLMYDALVAQPLIVDTEVIIQRLRISLIFLGGLIFVGLLAWLIYRRRARQKIQTNQLNTKVRELELTAIRAQMNPHFMYNCLNSIQNLVQKKQNDEAHRYLSKFAELIRSVLKNSEKEEVSLATELDMIRNYVELEKLRFDVDFTISLDEKIDAYSVFIPPLILQPLVENAILHGLAPKQDERNLYIEVQQNGKGSICVSITDNGVGRGSELLSSETSNGKGIKFSRERLNLLADKYGTSYHMQIEDLKNNLGQSLGTKVQICFPEE